MSDDGERIYEGNREIGRIYTESNGDQRLIVGNTQVGRYIASRNETYRGMNDLFGSGNQLMRLLR